MDLDDDKRHRRGLAIGGCAELARGMTEHYGKLHGAIGDLSKLLDELAPKVIGYETVALDANGQATRSYRVPFRAVYVESQSAHLLTVASSPVETDVPVFGPGVGYVKIGGASVLNMRAYTWAIWGGVANELVTVTVFSQPQPPFSR